MRLTWPFWSRALVEHQIEGVPGSDQAGQFGSGALRQAAGTRKILVWMDVAFGFWMIDPLAKLVAPLMVCDFE